MTHLASPQEIREAPESAFVRYGIAVKQGTFRATKTVGRVTTYLCDPQPTYKQAEAYLPGGWNDFDSPVKRKLESMRKR